MVPLGSAMQTVTLEFRTEDLTLLGVIPPNFFQKYEEVELLETLRLERGFRLQLLRLRRRTPLRSEGDLERESRRIRRHYGLESFEVIERRPRSREYILLVRQRNPEWLKRLLTLSGGEITPTAPFRIAEERVVATFHGEERALKRVLGRLEREGLSFRVLRASTHPYLGDAGAAALTGKQRAAVARAWALGFYAVPRRVTLSRLAKSTGQSPPALGKMLRRAEGHLIARFLSATEPDEGAPEPETKPE
ncbi:MAG: helix-turn-helix domain-containing protein [Thermoplasmata archaeon]|nr:helix-turn-helix domain-containing protein [Thermoplasmata archaeon]